MNRVAFVNRVWAATCARERRELERAVGDPRRVQEHLLLQTLRHNAGSEYGQRYQFGSVRSYADFAAAVPLVTWTDIQPEVDRIVAGEQGVLTSELVVSLEPTSGSAGPTKLVPVTSSLRAAFARGVAAWMSDVFGTVPGVLDGRAYWSISPVGTGARTSVGGLPIGFSADDEYAGALRGRLARAIQVVPRAVGQIQDMAAFRYATLRHLVAAPDLALVSVWNPTFLDLLVRALRLAGDELVRDVAEGGPGTAGSDGAPPHMPPDTVRADVVRRALEASDTSEMTALLWPRLRLLSCWADAAAGPPARALARDFAHATLQPKGLISTEAFVTLPMSWAPGHVPALRSHFIEILPDGSCEAVPIWDVEPGMRGEVLVTTGGGLYRYRTGDIVEAGARAGRCATLRFVGRGGSVSDRAGEKLSEQHVASALRAALQDNSIEPSFAMVVFDDESSPPGYVLLVHPCPDDPERIAAAVDLALRENFHYDYCRRLGQLGRLQAESAGANAWSRFVEESVARGQRVGDVKPVALHPGDGWVAILGGGRRVSVQAGSHG